ncbi:hypothetical protein ABH924_004742 [Arthrobacter sp. GAS37]|uniref:hypothetical protein n=1 Tax=Arthrobacter sp. GAS37 TaxID=3156261 RepID=UPI0038362CB4
MSTKGGPEHAIEQVSSSVAGKLAEQIEGILELIDAGALEATKAQRAYLAGAVHGIRLAAEQVTAG